jgi:predicted nucleic acid-binding protein
MLLLDTSALIGLERELAQREVGIVRTFLGRHKREDLACSTVTVGELAAGGNETATRVLLRHLRKISLSEAIAYRAGELDKKQMRRGMRLGENDNWIAATAMHYSATLVYADGDFECIEGIKRAKLSESRTESGGS